MGVDGLVVRDTMTMTGICRILAGIAMACAAPGVWAEAPYYGYSVGEADDVGDPFPSPSPMAMAASPASRAPRVPPVPGPALRAAVETWVEDRLASMTLDQKVGQLIMPQWTSGSAAGYLTNQKVGGFIFLASSSTTIVNATNALQTQAAGQGTAPLLFSVDCECGAGARVSDGTRFPYNMAVASGWLGGGARPADLEAGRQQGRITARECRALGLHVGFGPVVDVNTNADNPVIGVRSFSDDPARVADLAEAYMEGAAAEGLLTTLKHFPGHGGTDTDSHTALPECHVTGAALRAVHAKPYFDLTARGKGDLVMTAHVWFDALDPGATPWPATLSTVALTDLLRGEIGFQGTVVSDAFNMAGLGLATGTYDGARIGVQAGLDVVLMPTDPDAAFRGIRDAVLTGTITQARLDASVRRVLRLKSRVGMPETGTTASLAAAAALLRHPDHLAASADIGARAIAAAATRPGDLPLATTHTVLVMDLGGSGVFYAENLGTFTAALGGKVGSVTVQTVASNPSASARAMLVAQAAGFDRTLVMIRKWNPPLSAGQAALLAELPAAGRRTVNVSFGSPYHMTAAPGGSNWFCGFSSNTGTQAAMADVLTGAATPGRWPVTVSGYTGAAVADWALY